MRSTDGLYALVRQHDHGLLSGEFAKRWRERLRPLSSTLYAIANHDIAWRELDRGVPWNEQQGRPYSFLDFPPGPKTRAYVHGIDLVEAESPYAACLCSMHYYSFVRNSKVEEEVAFGEGEARRQERLKKGMSAEELENLDYNFRLLQLCDDLSLFVCLNEPGSNEHPWYRGGFKFMGERFEPVWEDRSTLRLDPSPFSSSFDFSLPYRLVDREGRPAGGSRFELRVIC